MSLTSPSRLAMDQNKRQLLEARMTGCDASAAEMLSGGDGSGGEDRYSEGSPAHPAHRFTSPTGDTAATVTPPAKLTSSNAMSGGGTGVAGAGMVGSAGGEGDEGGVGSKRRRRKPDNPHLFTGVNLNAEGVVVPSDWSKTSVGASRDGGGLGDSGAKRHRATSAIGWDSVAASKDGLAAAAPSTPPTLTTTTVTAAAAPKPFAKATAAAPATVSTLVSPSGALSPLHAEVATLGHRVDGGGSATPSAGPSPGPGATTLPPQPPATTAPGSGGKGAAGSSASGPPLASRTIHAYFQPINGVGSGRPSRSSGVHPSSMPAHLAGGYAVVVDGGTNSLDGEASSSLALTPGGAGAGMAPGGGAPIAMQPLSSFYAPAAPATVGTGAATGHGGRKGLASATTAAPGVLAAGDATTATVTPHASGPSSSMPADYALMKQRLDALQSACTTAQAALAGVRSEAAAAREEANRLRGELEGRKEDVGRAKAEREAAQRATAASLRVLLRDSVVKEQAALRRVMAEKHARLGRLVTHRQGHNVLEVWEEGDDFVALALAEARLKQRREELERLKKEVVKRNRKVRGPMATGGGEGKGNAGRGGRGKGGKAAAPTATPSSVAAGGDESDEESEGEGGGGGGDEGVLPSSDPYATLVSTTLAMAGVDTTTSTRSNLPVSALAANGAAAPGVRVDPVTELYLLDAEEGVTAALSALKREEGELVEQRKALEAEKAVFILDVKRWRAEASSKWHGCTVLGEPPRFMLLELLGKGGFSEVWRAMDLMEPREVAVKIHQLVPHWSEEKKRNYVKHALREYNIQKELIHAHVVRLHAVIEIDADCFATVLEYCRGGDLEKVIKSQVCLPEREARAIMIQVLTALLYLNGYGPAWENGGSGAGPAAGEVGSGVTPAMGGGAMAPPAARRKVIHYDLKPANILFDEYRNVKVTDFGLSKIIDESELGGDATSLELTSQGAGTYWYLPPECFRTGSAVRISNKVDVWSLGVVFYQMLYGRRPFGEGLSQEQMVASGTLATASAGPPFPAKPVISTEAKDFIRRCLTVDVSTRPDVRQLCDDKYFRLKMK